MAPGLPAQERGADPADPFDADFVRRLEYWSLFFKRVYGGDLSAARRSREVGSGIEFSDRREYLPGDDPRYLDWKAYARLDRVLLRLFEEEKDLRVHVMLDRSRSMKVGGPSKMLAAKRVAAALAYIVLANLDRVAITLFAGGIDEFSPPARGKARVHPILEMLRGVEADGLTDIASSAIELTSREKRKGLVFILSDFLVSGGVVEALDRLRYHGHEVTLIRVVSRLDREPRVSGEVEIVDAETGRRLRAVVTPAVLRRYSQRFEDSGRRIEAAALGKGARLVTILSEDGFDDHITTILRAIGKHK
jgi:uncharacterized protein (DUF58 family)